MKLYSNQLGPCAVHAAFRDARGIDQQDIGLTDMRAFSPRGPERNGVEFYAESSNGRRAAAHRAIGSCSLGDAHRAASWTAYGYVIARLYAWDPDARIGKYRNRADFIAQVTYRVPRGESDAFLALAGS